MLNRLPLVRWWASLLAVLVLPILFFNALPAWAEGSQSLYPSGIAGSRAFLDLSRSFINNQIREQGFFYVYAEAGEYILLGSSNRRATSGGDIRVFNPQPFGAKGNETIPATVDFTCSGGALTGAPGPHYFGGTTGQLNARAQELAGPRSADNSADAPPPGGGHTPCAYRAPSTGIYGVQFTAATSGGTGTPNGEVAPVGNFMLGSSTVAAWDITVRADATSTTNLDGRVFNYAWGGFTGANALRVYSNLYYITSDGFRYRQTLRGLDPNAYALYSNAQGFLDGGQPLYKDLRSKVTNSSLNDISLNTFYGSETIATQAPQYPIFYSDISPGGANNSEVNLVLGALGISTSPPPPVVNSFSFTYGFPGNSTTYVGRGGTFDFQTTDTISYQIIISRDGSNWDPAATANRVLTGLAGTGFHAVVWDGKDNAGGNFPVGTYLFRIFGRSGEVHFPFIDAENNASGGPTVTKLNGTNIDSIVYFDDRGYTTSGGVSVGVPNDSLCGSPFPTPPTPDVNLIGLDSSDANYAGPGIYYRSWGDTNAVGNSNVDCSNNNPANRTSNDGFGNMKALDLWTYQTTTPQENTFNIIDAADVMTTVAAPSSAAPGSLAVVPLGFGNIGSLNADNVTYGLTLPTGLSGVTCSGATCDYNSATGLVTVNGLPGSLSPGQWVYPILSYTVPATGAVAVTTTVATTSAEPTPDVGPNTATGTTTVASGGTNADVTVTINPPALATGGTTVNVPITFINVGPATADNMTYAAQLPAGLSGVTCSVGVTCNYNSSTGAVSITAGLPGSLAAGAPASVILSYTAPGSGNVQVEAAVGTSTPETSTSNNTAVGSTTITTATTADVTTTIAPPATATAGSTVNVPITFTNNGPSPAAGVIYSAQLPAGLTGVSCPPAACNYNSGSGLVTITGLPATLANGQTVNVTLSYIAPASGTVPVSSTITTTTSESNNSNNTASSSTSITASDMSVSLGGLPATAQVGAPYSGSFSCINNSTTTDATNATCAVSNLPAGVSVGSCTISPSNAPWTTGQTVPISQTVTCVVSGTPTTSGPVTVTGSTGATNDSNPANNTATTSITVAAATPANPPAANNDSAVTPLDTPVTVPVTANDAAASGAPLDPATIDLDPATAGQQTSKTLEGLGTFTLNTSTGAVTFTPVSGFVGVATIPYTIQDSLGQISNTANITVTVNDSAIPAATDDSATTALNTPVVINVPSNDTASTGATLDPSTVDLDPSTPAIDVSRTTTEGVWTVNASGQVTFTPATGFTGTATLPYTIQDSTGATSNTATIRVTVAAASGLVAANDSASTTPSTPVTLNPAANDTPGSGNTLDPTTIDLDPSTPGQDISVTVSGQGVWTLDPVTGLVTFTPEAGFTGTATLPYAIEDSSSAVSNLATMTVVVNPTANPTAQPDSTTTGVNTPVTLTPASNDTASTGATLNPSTVDLDPATAGVQRGPITTAQGTWEVIDSAGTARFTPATGFTGTATLDYTISDSLGHTATTTMTVTVTAAAVADVYTTVSAPAGAPLNGVINAILTYGNQGTAVASNVSYSATLPPGLSGVSCNGATCSYNSSTGVVTVTGLPTSLSPGQTEQVVLSYTATAPGTLAVQSTINTTSTDSNLSNNISSASTTVPAPAIADVAALVDAPTTATAGSTVQVGVSFINLGTATATGVSYTLTLPAGLSNVSCSGATCSYNSSTGVVTITGLPDSLAAGQTTNLTLSYTAPASGSVTVTASTNASNDSNSGNNSASDSTAVSTATTADVTTTVAAPATAVPGSPVAVPVTFGNLGPAPAAGMSYSLALPPGLTGVGCGGAMCSYDSNTGTVTVTGLPGTLAPGQTVGLTLSYTAPASGSVTVTSTAGTSTTDSNPGNNSASASTAVGRGTADVYTTVTVPSGAPAGGVVHALIAYGNQGSSVATGTTYTIALATGLSGVGCGGATCSYDSNTGIVTVTGLPTSLSPGQTEHVLLSYTAPTPASGTVTLPVTSSITTTSTDSNPGNNTATGNTVVPTAAIVDVTVWLDMPPAATPGSTVNVPVNFGNLGTAPATGVTYSLALPPGLTGVSCGGATCSYDSNTGIVTVTGLPGTLAPGQTVGLTLSYTAPTSGSVTVTAGVNAGNDSNPGNNSASDSTISSVATTADVTTTVAAPATAAPGTSVAVPVTFGNLGPAPATGVTYSLALPPGLTGVSCGGATCSYDSNTGILTVTGLPGTLAPGQTVDITLNYTAPTSGSVTVTAGANAGNDSNPNNNSASGRTVIIGAPVDIPILSTTAMLGLLTLLLLAGWRNIGQAARRRPRG